MITLTSRCRFPNGHGAMQMPRFGTRGLLVAFAVAALWLSTFSGYRFAQDVRHSVLLLILVTSGLVAVYSRGRRRAFWSAFVAVMLLCGGLSLDRPLYRYVPDFAWLEFEQSYYQSTPAQPISPYIPIQQSPPPGLNMMYGPPTPIPVGPAQVPGSTMQEAINETISAAWTVALAVIAGFIAAYISKRMPNSANEPS